MTRTYTKQPAMDRFMSFVDHTSGGCWQWTGYTKEGQGQFNFDSRPVQSRRWIYEQVIGKLAYNKVIKMRCGEVACVNPDHMCLVARGATR